MTSRAWALALGVFVTGMFEACHPGVDELLGPPAPLSDYGTALKITDDGMVIGVYQADFVSSIPGLWRPMTRRLAALRGDSIEYGGSGFSFEDVQAVSDSGTIFLNVPTLGWFSWRPGTDIISLPTLGGPLIVVQAVSPGGRAVGYASDQAGNLSSYLLTGTDIQLLPGFPDHQVVGVNDAGTVLLETASWKDGVETPLPADTTLDVRARDINQAGLVTGRVRDSLTLRAAVWVADSLQLLPVPDSVDSSQGVLINERGEVAGTISIIGSVVPVVWSSDSMHLIGSPVDDRAQPVDLNDSGAVLLTWQMGFPELGTLTDGRSYLYRDGVAVDLGLLDGTIATLAVDVNNVGQVVGTAWTAEGFPMPFLWEAGVLRALSLRRP